MTLPIHAPRFLKHGPRTWIQAILLLCLCLVCAYSITQRRKPQTPAASKEKAPSPNVDQVKARFYNPTSDKPPSLSKKEKEKRADAEAQWIRADSARGKPVKYPGIHLRFKLGEKYFCQDQIESKDRSQLQLRSNVVGHLIFVSKDSEGKYHRLYPKEKESRIEANKLLATDDVQIARKKEFVVFFSTEYPKDLMEITAPDKLFNAIDKRITNEESLVCDASTEMEYGNYIVSEKSKQVVFKIVPQYKP